MKKKVVGFAGVVLLLLAVVGCSLFLTQVQQDAVANLTLDQKARLVADGFQSQLERDFDSAKAYVDSSPDPTVKAAWKAQIVPIFDSANKALAKIIGAGALASGTVNGNMTPDEIYAKIQPFMADLIRELVNIGFKRK
jgi:hypothetical protein